MEGEELMMLVEDILERPYQIVDIFPAQVPQEGADRYFWTERYYQKPQRLQRIYRKYAEILLRLNCFWPMRVSFDWGGFWDEDPDPETFAEKVGNLPGNGHLRVLFLPQETLIDLDAPDTSVTVFSPEPALWEILQKLAAAEGFFTWQPPEE
ncbi:MAG: hypothetical protein J5493_00330 [Lachnospiraceae bacterium]|nr:hypothetical protein [Lachnospiraceae bacterium]